MLIDINIIDHLDHVRVEVIPFLLSICFIWFLFVGPDGIAGTFLAVISMKKLSRKQVLLPVDVVGLLS